MRRLSVIAAWVPLAVMAGQVPGSVEGRVTNAQTGDALAGATVRLNPANRAIAPPQITSSQADGGFRFEGVPAGSYLLSGEKSGFVANVLGGSRPPIVVSPGQQLSNVALPLTPAGIISGKIIDEKGDPIPNATAQLFTIQTTGGKLQLRAASRAVSDSKGEYRLKDVAPGKYYLAAEPQARSSPDTDADQSSFALVRTFYPQSLSFETASVVDISPGQNLEGTDIRVRRTSTFHIRGQIAMFEQTSAAEGWNLSLAPRGMLATDAVGKIMQLRKDGSFDFDGVLPGSYTLTLRGMARVNSGEPDVVQYRSRLLARQDLELGASDVNGVVISVIPPVNLTGHVAIEGTANADLSRLRVNFVPAGEIVLGTFQSVPVKSDGSFAANNLDPGQYVVRVVGAAAGAYLRSATFNRQDITTTGIDVMQGGSGELALVLKSGVAEVGGTVQASEADSSTTTPVSRANILVALVPAILPPDGSGILFTSAVPGGNFVIRGVSPGRYYAFALERWATVWQNRDFLNEMQKSGTSVEVTENAHLQIQLATTTEAEVREVAARLGLAAQ